MKAIHFLYAGAGLDALVLLLGLLSFATLFACVPEQSRMNMALIIIFLIAGLARAGFLVKNMGKILVANIPVRLPAVPGLLFCGFVSFSSFMIFSTNKHQSLMEIKDKIFFAIFLMLTFGGTLFVVIAWDYYRSTCSILKNGIQTRGLVIDNVPKPRRQG